MIKSGLFAAITLGAMVMFTSSAMAQAQQGRGQRGPEAQLERLTTELKLDDKQKARAKTVLEEQIKQMQALREDSGQSPEDRRAKMQSIRQEGNKKMKEILTAEQFKKYEELQAQRGPQGRPQGERERRERNN
jgi:periplasmic protein CpxP/Spy